MQTNINDLTYFDGTRLKGALFTRNGSLSIKRHLGSDELLFDTKDDVPKVCAKHPGKIDLLVQNDGEFIYYEIVMSYGPKVKGRLTISVLKVGKLDQDLNPVEI